MPCVFPTYSTITPAEILGVIYPRSSIGRWNEALIASDLLLGDMSVAGQAISYFNQLATDSGVDYSALSDALCSKLILSLRWYIVGKYRERDLELEGCPECCDTDELICLANQRACVFITQVDTSIAAIASFCTYKSGKYGLSDFFGISGYKPCECEG